MTRSCITGSDVLAPSAGEREGEAGNVQGEIYRRLRRRIDRIVGSTFGADSECSDVAQDVFVEIIRGSSKLKDPACFESWAATVAVYTVRRELRRRRRRRWILWDALENPDLLNYEPNTDSREVATRMNCALDKLPDEERELLLQRALRNRSMSELATDLGCSLSTARRRLNQARERLFGIARRDAALGPWLTSSR